MLVALASMTLGLIIAAATTSFETRRNEVETSASRIIALDSTLAKYGEPAREARVILQQVDQAAGLASEANRSKQSRLVVGCSPANRNWRNWASRCWWAGRASARWATSPADRCISGSRPAWRPACAPWLRGRTSCGCMMSPPRWTP